ncbi:phage BR0599 family protein [Pseudomonas nitroreducens]|uniref:phage BR0599 family protein n=1 Tax=Pseudomonas nitroreducens TaxID=46680 RepID=UPI002D7ED059|nr:phage BR0599 family protein [Pseudomonas nitroreducens]
MSYDSRERSLADGQPIRLYQFSRGVLRWAYSSADRDIAHNNMQFKTVRGGIVDAGIRQSSDASTDLLKVTAPADLDVARLFRGVPPSGEIAVTVFDRHFAEAGYVVGWAGSIQSVSWPDPDRCQIVCQPLAAKMAMQGLRCGWERSCHRALYDLGCTVNRDLYRVESSIQAMDGISVTNGGFAAYPDGYFTAGFVEWSIGSGEYDRRMIERHAGGVLTILGGTSGLGLGQPLRVYPGCDQTIQVCHTRFNNKDNFAGIWHLAGRSPFDGNPVFT